MASENDLNVLNSNVEIHSASTDDNISAVIRHTLLLAFCFMNFLDAFNNSAILTATPPITANLEMDNSTAIWLLSAYQLTFAALLLISGRLSDLYNPKIILMGGLLLMSFCSLGAGFTQTKIPMLVLRAFMGIGAALNVPAAMSIIVCLFPQPAKQSSAVAVFASAAAIGAAIGPIMGAALVDGASWRWVFYLTTITSFVLAVVTLVLLPNKSTYRTRTRSAIQIGGYSPFQRLDPVGITALTASLILFVFAVTSGSVNGWGTAMVIVPLILSVTLAVFFGFWENKLPEALAVVPTSIWFYPNFIVLTAICLQPFMWFASVQFLFSWLYQDVYGWSTLTAGIHLLPIGLVAFVITSFVSALQQKLQLKWVIIIGEILGIVGSILLPFANAKDKYWRFAFPGICIGTAGMTIIFGAANIALFAITPPEVSGVVGAIFMCSLQLGSAAGASVVASIQTSVQVNHGGPDGFAGRAAGFWFLLGFTVVQTLMVLIFMQSTVAPAKQSTVVVGTSSMVASVEQNAV